MIDMSNTPTIELLAQVREEIDIALDHARKEGADRVINAILQGKIKLPPLDKTIFVSVAAYCEPHLEFTLDSMFSAAFLPQNLRVGVFDQSAEDNLAWLSKKPYWENIRYLQADHHQSRGASWARAVVGTMYSGEDFYFQIDSHTLFDPGWDRTLLDAYERLLTKVDKPIISTYPLPFKFKDGVATPTMERINAVYMMGLLPNADFHKKGINYGSKVYYEQSIAFKNGFHLAGGFIFTQGSFVEDIPYDPYLYFEGEEQNLAVRAFTHGWTIMHPNDKFIPIYHLYKDNDSGADSHHWNDEHDTTRSVKWVDQYRRAEKRLADLLFYGKPMGVYGLGTQRTLKDFAEFSGIDFINRIIEPRAYADKVEPETKG